MTPRARVDRILDETRGVESQCGIDSWTKQFLTSVRERGYLSPKQDEMLTRIELRVFGEDDE